ncbi:Crp/Fnr family transcriptional regulator [Pontibacter kalidii]|uniref:Crp/Fnr family transcriptional regulator n=1 Tax=Pontibacter kalidii TaxID=2592049 RepID=UPI0022504AE7|nr:cyclic nucleotide-binding domain-containing protein [Pontibacter kalidii]
MLKKAIKEGMLQVTQRELVAGTYLYKTGEPAESFFLVVQGAVLVSMLSLPKNTLVQQGHLVGLQDLMKEQHSHTAILAENATLVEIPKQELLKAIQTMAPLRLYLIRLMSQQPNLATLAYE